MAYSTPALRSISTRGRFGFHNASSIDNLLDKEDVSLEAILDEDELIQECKAQNTRLIDYFQRVDVLQRLLGYVSGRIEGEDERTNERCAASLYTLSYIFDRPLRSLQIPLHGDRGTLR